MKTDVFTQPLNPLIGLASLMRMAFSGVDLAPLGTQLIARADTEPRTADANALLDLSIVLQLRARAGAGDAIPGIAQPAAICAAHAAWTG